jgi:hypothetical protein
MAWLPYEEIPLIGEMSAKLTKGLPFSPEKAVTAKAVTEGWTPPLFLFNPISANNMHNFAF